jgi:hypothetical protein
LAVTECSVTSAIDYGIQFGTELQTIIGNEDEPHHARSGFERDNWELHDLFDRVMQQARHKVAILRWYSDNIFVELRHTLKRTCADSNLATALKHLVEGVNLPVALLGPPTHPQERSN